ncbi:hypothetical protein DL95DRAFT_472038 [Leptodontidium sp. 2 PMI_412]|nr:hypothetical protein DL95DRAFT_472038 [Leptodontidium sp. 2 PMI_412]
MSAKESRAVRFRFGRPGNQVVGEPPAGYYFSLRWPLSNKKKTVVDRAVDRFNHVTDRRFGCPPGLIATIKVSSKFGPLRERLRNELFPRIGTTPTANAPSPPWPPSSPQPSIAPGQIPGIGLDLSRVAIPEIKEGNAGTVRRRVNEALKGKGITCLGVNSKGNGRYRLLFHGDDVDKVRRDDTWLRTHFDTLYGEQWYPMRVDRVYHEVATDEVGCTLFGRLNGVKVHKMRWLGNVSVDKEYRSMVIYLDTKEEVDRLLAEMTVTMANGECASPIRHKPSTCAMLSLSPLWPFTLPLPSASSGLWTVCTPGARGIGIHLDDL